MEMIIFPALSMDFRPLKQKTHSACEWVESFLLLNSLTETPPATWLDAK
jgi:hypothetical protein